MSALLNAASSTSTVTVTVHEIGEYEEKRGTAVSRFERDDGSRGKAGTANTDAEQRSRLRYSWKVESRSCRQSAAEAAVPRFLQVGRGGCDQVKDGKEPRLRASAARLLLGLLLGLHHAHHLLELGVLLRVSLHELDLSLGGVLKGDLRSTVAGQLTSGRQSQTIGKGRTAWTSSSSVRAISRARPNMVTACSILLC